MVKVHDKRRFNQDGEPKADTVSEPAPLAPSPEQQEIERLKAELATAHKRVDDLARAFQASEKDREDFKIRSQRERERLLDVERGQVALALVEALDDLDLCLANADQSPLAQGVRLIRGDLLKKLESTGVVSIQVEGKRFDPNRAEAADMELTTDESKDQLVLAVLRAGYELNGRIVRPAKVKVAKFVKPADA